MLLRAKPPAPATSPDKTGLHRVTDQRRPPPPIALAMEWVAKITTVGLEMIVPAIGGRYLDHYLGTQYWTVVGLVIGVVFGFWHLLQMTKVVKQDDSKGEGSDGGSADA